MATETCDLSPTMRVGEANVSSGFSMPPKGKEGGRMATVYVPIYNTTPGPVGLSSTFLHSRERAPQM